MSIFSVGGNVGVALAPTGVILTVGVLGLGATPLLAIPAVVMAVVYLLRMRAVRMRARRDTMTAPDAVVGTVTGPHPAQRDASSPGAAVEAAVEIALEEELAENGATDGIGTDSRRPAQPASGEAPQPGDAHPAPAPPVRDDWRAFAWLTLVLAFWSVAYVGVSSFISLFQIQQFGADEATASIALTVFPAAGAVGTLAGGFLADRWGRMRTIRTGYIAAALGTLAIVLAPDTVVVVAATAVVGFTIFLPFAPQITLSHSYLPNRVGTASGLTLGLTLSLGGFLNPLLGLLADHTTVQTLFALLVGLLTVGFALSFVLRERVDPVLRATRTR
jgi:FSR family fosmidomycin resistance protein-like MFS transporter